MPTPDEFMMRVAVEWDDGGWVLLLDGREVARSREPADLRRALIGRLVAEPRTTKDGRQLKQYKAVNYPRRHREHVFDVLDRRMRRALRDSA